MVTAVQHHILVIIMSGGVIHVHRVTFIPVHKVDIDQLSSMCHVSLKPIEYSDKIYINKCGQLNFQSESVGKNGREPIDPRYNLKKRILLSRWIIEKEKRKLKSSFPYSDSPMNDHERYCLWIQINIETYIF